MCEPKPRKPAKKLKPLTRRERRLAEKNYRLAHYACHKVLRKTPVLIQQYGGLDDAVQEASLALCRALKYWKKERGIRLSTYAVLVITRWLRDQCRKQQLVGSPARGRHFAVAVTPPPRRDGGDYWDNLPGRSTTSELAEEASVAEDQALAHELLNHEALNPIDREVLEAVYFRGERLCDIARARGLGRQRISQRHVRGLKTLREVSSQGTA